MITRCDECDPVFGCFDGGAPCSKKPAADPVAEFIRHAEALVVRAVDQTPELALPNLLRLLDLGRARALMRMYDVSRKRKEE